MNAAEERDYSAARGHLATARLLSGEAERAVTLWKKATVKDYSFDPLTMPWPRDFWLVLGEMARRRRRTVTGESDQATWYLGLGGGRHGYRLAAHPRL
ncbi:hypothetical protein [Streptomyces sp. NPDC088725]|uniref:hypothetical protein n=1 Tax=Streptomyces sp. NPDC088725 TaxID=3365873 RepID=UPI0038064744